MYARSAKRGGETLGRGGLLMKVIVISLAPVAVVVCLALPLSTSAVSQEAQSVVCVKRAAEAKHGAIAIRRHLHRGNRPATASGKTAPVITTVPQLSRGRQMAAG